MGALLERKSRRARKKRNYKENRRERKRLALMREEESRDLPDVGEAQGQKTRRRSPRRAAAASTRRERRASTPSRTDSEDARDRSGAGESDSEAASEPKRGWKSHRAIGDIWSPRLRSVPRCASPGQGGVCLAGAA